MENFSSIFFPSFLRIVTLVCLLTVYMIIRCLLAAIVIAGYYFSSCYYNHCCSTVSSFYDSQVRCSLLGTFGTLLGGLSAE